jgi:hypothetical protein
MSTSPQDIVSDAHSIPPLNLTDDDIGKKFVGYLGRPYELKKWEGDLYPFKIETAEHGTMGIRTNGEASYDPIRHAAYDLICPYREAIYVPPVMLRDDYQPSQKPLAENVKESNPKDAVGVRKVPVSTLSMPVMLEVAAAMLEGARKYGRHNYRVIGVRASVYFDAAFRHLSAWWEGEDVDPDSGLSHVTKAIATLTVLRDAMIREKMVDDRPPGTSGFVKELNTLCGKVCERYPDAKEPFLANGTSDTYKA